MHKHYGVKKEDLEKIDEIDIDKEIEEKDKNEKDKNEKDKAEKDRDNKDKDKKDEKEENKELTASKTKKLDIREETSANKSLKGQTLRNKLGLDKEGITDVVKIARVTTSSLERVEGEKISNQVDTFVAIKSNGEAVVLRRKYTKTR